MSGLDALDPEVQAMCLIAVLTTAASTIALLAGIIYYRRTSERHTTGWTRFQIRAFTACISAIGLDIVSIVEVFFVMFWMPENLSETAGTLPGVWNKGELKIAVSITEILGQVLLSITIFSYYLVLLERMTSFRFLLPSRFFHVVHQTLFLLGVLLFLPMLSVGLVINLAPSSSLVVAIAVLFTNSLTILVILLEWTLSIALYQAFVSRIGFESQPAASINLGRRETQNNNIYANPVTASEKRDLKVNESAGSPSYPPTLYAVQSRSTSDPTSEASVRGMSATVRSATTSLHTSFSSPDLVFEPGTSFRSVLRDANKRRSILLFVGFALSDVLAFIFYGMALVPQSGQYARPLEVMARASIGFHYILALIFLDSFKMFLRHNLPSTRQLTTRPQH
ncbi:hypothetical protein BJ742DRAFT_826052 [Cladochytrium replicatum]|nr:hypothetical protein BJ742DRAFT_826052 [Cladochytrium replicatum]